MRRRRETKATAAIAAIAVAALGTTGVAGLARGQRVDPKRARTIVVGAPRGASPAERVDGARTGEARTPLPTGTLHVAWRKSLGVPVEAAPLVDARGDITVLATRGDLFVLAPDGEERTRTNVGSAAVSAAALLSDGTAVFLTSAGDAVGVRLGDVRFRARLGGGRSSVTPLALDDGGFVVATPSELVALDGEGHARARAAFDPGDPAVELLGPAPGPDGPTVYIVTGSGAVIAWVPAAGREASRVARFGGVVDGGAALLAGPPVLLVAVVGGTQLVAVDPARGTTTTRAAAASLGAVAFLGPPSVVSSPAPSGPSTGVPARVPDAARAGPLLVFLAATASRPRMVALDPGGADLLHQPVGSTPLVTVTDAGVPLLDKAPAHLAPVVDARGAVAFALPTGELGVVSPGGAVDELSNGAICSRFGGSPLADLGARSGPTFAGLAPAAPYALVVACGIGVVARVDSDFAPSP